MQNILKEKFPNATKIVVQDISGGCGAMFEVNVVSNEFSGVPKVKQHLQVSQVFSIEFLIKFFLIVNFHFLGTEE